MEAYSFGEVVIVNVKIDVGFIGVGGFYAVAVKVKG
jgi:hypothetical protein